MVSWALDAKVDRFGTVFVQELTAAAGRAGEVPVPQANRGITDESTRTSSVRAREWTDDLKDATRG
jgi:hypothetical protein